MFEVGDKVVHPHHGAGVVTRRETRVVLGEEREYLTIHIPLTDLAAERSRPMARRPSECVA